jgi:hypothetical protein
VEDELGTIRSEHRARISAVVWQLLLAGFCFAVVYACIALPFGKWKGTPLERFGVVALFGLGGAILLYYAWKVGGTRVELCDRGFRYSGKVVRWSEVRSVEGWRVNGQLKSITVFTADRKLQISSGIEDFDHVVTAMRERMAR